jgi:pyruvate formate lyase activating enzyme
MAKLITKLNNISKVDLLPYHTAGKVKYPKWNMVYKMNDTEPPTNEEIEHSRNIFLENGIRNLQVGG